MSYEHLIVERGGSIATVTMNRPEKANALNGPHLLEIEDCALSFQDDADTRVVIFTGAGKHFSSGADLSDGGRGAQPLVQRRRTSRYGQRAIQALLDMDQITIAAWNGAAMGGGGCIATALDFRIGADDCFLAYPEIDIGLNLMWQSLPLITHLVGPARAKRAVIGGEHLRAETLLSWGVLDELVPRAELLARARAMAEFYAAKPPVPAQMIKRSVNAITQVFDRAVMHMDFDQNILAGGTEDSRTAAAAYRAKRPATFSGN